MKYCKLISILFVLTVISCQKNTESTIDIFSLDWTLRNDDSSIILNKVDPSDVHLALIQGGIIADPFYRDNEKQLQWIGTEDWIFETEFDIDKVLLNKEKIELIFEGLDTHADVSLNDSLILSANNMFREWNVDVKELLKPKSNNLKICFSSATQQNTVKQNKLSYQLPDKRGFTRKAAYHFGWDWGPTFVTSGIWRPAYIKAWDVAIIREMDLSSLEIDEKQARFLVEMEIESTGNNKLKFQIYIDDELLEEQLRFVKKGKNTISIPTHVNNPKLWWPNGYGEQNLYPFTVRILDESRVLDEKTIKTGFRVIELVQDADSIGESFYFKVNGVPIFSKGANYIPQDNFLPRVQKKDYEQLIIDAKKSNMNMLRVWGGGAYEDDVFYELCDAHGIMVWQDFMFACNMYPGDTDFIENVKNEAIDNIKRIRSHPSLVLWCGNNEADEAWHNWGWQKQFEYSPEDSSRIWNDYLYLFEELLPELVDKYDPSTPYWPSSPSIGWGHEKAYAEGDVHYWGVWWGGEPFEKYEEKVGRFMSEYGFQGMPDLKTIKEFTEPGDRVLGSEVLDAHQKHPFGWDAIEQYMERDFKVPENFEDYIYVSQLLQAEGIKTAIAAHRMAKPYCMGTLYWQLNDCWPVISWSGIDYYGRWKALQYYVKKAYDTYLISYQQTNEEVDIYLISDSLDDTDALLKWKILDFEGAVLKSEKKNVRIKENSSKIFATVSTDQFLNQKSNIVLLSEIWYNDELLCNSRYYFTRPKDLNLPEANISIEVKRENNEYLILLTSEKLAKAVCLSCTMDGFFSDNYFDLLPGEEKTIRFTSDCTNDENPKFEIKCLNNIY
ncbi:MAG: glycoside hydrolase family 2 protein [Deltaproteobacteria bacterium]|nr:MAG: glycoside hydrolase family 2 protein [Deltaproteobacteria bacterium]